VAFARQVAQELAESGTRWCAGLPCVAEERLTELQRSAAERVYARARNAFIGYAGLALIGLPAALGLCLWGSGRVFERGWLALAVAFTVFAMSMPLCVARALDHGRTALPLRRDLEDGFLWVFEGRLAQARYEEEDPGVAQLLAAGLFVRGEAEQRISVLPRSGRLLHVNGQNVPPDRRLHVGTTAPWPEHVYRYSLPPEVKEVFGPSARELKRRRIADAERDELKRHVARLTAVPWLLIALTALTSATVSLWLVRDETTARDLGAAVAVVAWLYVALRHLQGYTLARRLEADLDVGWLLSWQVSEIPGPVRPSTAREDGRPPFQHAEVLPVSQRDWMIDGKPAAWRRVLSRSA
jgi:hypothetical protein